MSDGRLKLWHYGLYVPSGSSGMWTALCAKEKPRKMRWGRETTTTVECNVTCDDCRKRMEKLETCAG